MSPSAMQIPESLFPDESLFPEGFSHKVSHVSASVDCQNLETGSISSPSQMSTRCGSFDSEAMLRSRTSSVESDDSDAHNVLEQEGDCPDDFSDMSCLNRFGTPFSYRGLAILPVSSELLSLLTSRRGSQRLQKLRRLTGIRIDLDVKSHVIYMCGSMQQAFHVKNQLLALEGTAMQVTEPLWNKLMEFRTCDDSMYSLASLQRMCNCRLHVDRLRMEVRVFGFEEDLPRAKMVLDEMEELVATLDETQENVEDVDTEVPAGHSVDVAGDGNILQTQDDLQVEVSNLQPEYLEPKELTKLTFGSKPCKVDLKTKQPPGIESIPDTSQKVRRFAPDSGLNRKIFKVVRDEEGKLEIILV